ncbi:MAG: TolC family protein [Elusimicrobiota bacterium]|jgi:outer membrane protein
MLAPFLAAALLAGPGGAQPMRSLDLEQAYKLALARSEELAQRGETVVRLEARIFEMGSYLKPQAYLAAAQTIQDLPPGGATSSIPRERNQAQIQVHQTLFTGLREYLAVRQARAQKASAQYLLQRARQLLYQDVVRAYLDLLAVRHEVGIRQAILATTDDRIKELRQRQRLGRSRKSEVLAVESQQAQDAAQLETARGAEAVAQLQLRFLTGWEEDVVPAELPAVSAAAVDAALAEARGRPDVEAARRDRDAAGYPASIASRQRWPVANMDGNYYLHRQSPYDKVYWDVAFSLSLPLYTGGIIGAQVREAEALRRSADQALSLALRRAELEVRAAGRDLDSALTIVAALEKAAKLAADNAQAQSDDYRSGLVTNLDVLGSLSALQQTRLKLDAARIGAFWSRTQLDVAAGLPGARL